MRNDFRKILIRTSCKNQCLFWSFTNTIFMKLNPVHDEMIMGCTVPTLQNIPCNSRYCHYEIYLHSRWWQYCWDISTWRAAADNNITCSRTMPEICWPPLQRQPSRVCQYLGHTCICITWSTSISFLDIFIKQTFYVGLLVCGRLTKYTTRKKLRAIWFLHITIVICHGITD